MMKTWLGRISSPSVINETGIAVKRGRISCNWVATTQMIDDDDRDTQVGRHVLQQPDIGVEPAQSQPTRNNREVLVTG